MVTSAVTLSDLIEKGGAYAGLAAFFGFAVLSVLAFAQAREIRRLRDWAGRAPERAQELEQRVVEQAEQARRVVATPSRRPGEPATAAAQGVVAKPVAKPAVETPEAKPAPVAAEAETTAQPAVAAESPDEPASADEETATEHEVVATTPAADAEVEAPVETEPETAEEAAEEAAVPVGTATTVTPAGPAPANGSGEAPPKLPPRATQGPPAKAVPPVRRPAPQPLRATQPPSRRPAPASASSSAETSGGRRTPVIVAAVAAGLILIVIGLLAIFTGGDDEPQQANTPTTQQPEGTATSSATADGGGKKRPTTVPRADTDVAVLNGTTITGLAGKVDTSLAQAGYTESQEPRDYTDQNRSASIVFYNGSENRTAAIEIGKLLDISDRQPIDTAAAQLAPGADVVVVTGADQTP